jgi:hypothetical protein
MAFFGPPPLLKGEDVGAYGDLLARVSAAIKPADIFEEMWLRDFLDLAWEAWRFRRVKAAVIDATVSDSLGDVLWPLLAAREAAAETAVAEPGAPWPPCKKLVEGWRRRDREIVAQVDALLAGAGLTIDAAIARVPVDKLDKIDRLDRTIASAEARRNAVLREIERHRATLGQELRRLVPEAEDADFEVIESPPAAAAAGVT